MYDAYSTPTCMHWDVKYQILSVLPVLLCLPLSFERCGLWHTRVPDNCSSSFTGEAVSIGTLVDKLILSTQSWLMYVLSYATDWPGLSVGHPMGALAYFCHWVLSIHGWLTLSVMLCQKGTTSRETSTLIGCFTHTNCFGTNSCKIITITILGMWSCHQEAWWPFGIGSVIGFLSLGS